MDKKLIRNVCYGSSALISAILCISNASLILIDANPGWITNAILFIFLYCYTVDKVVE